MRGWLIRVVLVRSLSLLRWGYVEGIALTWCLPGGSLLPDLRQLRLALLVPLLPRKFLAPGERVLDLGLEECRGCFGSPMEGP